MRNLKCQVRAMHLTLDRFLEKHLPVNHPLVAWLVEHAAFVRLIGAIGRDGRSAYNRIRGTENKLRLLFLVNEFVTKADHAKEVLLAVACVGVMAFSLECTGAPTNTWCSILILVYGRRVRS